MIKVHTSHHIDCKCFSVKLVFDFVLPFTHMLAYANARSVFHLYLNIDFRAASSD